MESSSLMLWFQYFHNNMASNEETGTVSGEREWCENGKQMLLSLELIPAVRGLPLSLTE